MIRVRLVFLIGLGSLLMACGSKEIGSENDEAGASEATAPAAVSTTPKPSDVEPASGLETASPTAADSDRAGGQEGSAQPESGAAVFAHLEQRTMAHFPGAGSIDFTVNDDGRIYVAYGQANNVYVTQSPDGGETFGEAVVASQEGNVFVYGLERPAIKAGADGRIHVAWPEDSYPGHIWYAVSNDDGETFGPSLKLSGEGPETVLVRLLLEPTGSPLAVWLQNSELHFTRTEDGGESFLPDRVIDDQTCDCCHPQPLWLNGELHIAYRNLVIDDDGQQIRDIYLVSSRDGGDSFEETVRVSDEPWYLAACPFSGPSLVSDGEQTLFVSWMDGRNDVAKNLSQTDIWLAISTDGGRTFSANRRINQTTGVYNNLPSLSREENGLMHFLWQEGSPERDVLNYTVSNDEGQTFAAAQVLIDSGGDNRRRPANATLLVDQTGVVYTSWVDGEGGYLATWQASGDGG